MTTAIATPRSTTAKTLVRATIASPIGHLLAVGGEDADGRFSLRGLYIEGGSHPGAPAADWRPAEAPFAGLREQLGDYFAGEQTGFDLALKPAGTAFQRRVWSELERIPHGETISYGELARRTGRPRAFRAVGAANGRNPISIVIPCHRVIGSDGSLSGYAGGVERKRFLLELEGAAASA